VIDRPFLPGKLLLEPVPPLNPATFAVSAGADAA